MKATINGITYEGTTAEMAQLQALISGMTATATVETVKTTAKKTAKKTAKPAAKREEVPAPKTVKRRNGKRMAVMTATDHAGLPAGKVRMLNNAVKRMNEAGFACHWRVIGEWAWLVSDDRKGFTKEFKAMQPKICTRSAQWSYSPKRGRMMIPGFYKADESK